MYKICNMLHEFEFKIKISIQKSHENHVAKSKNYVATFKKYIFCLNVGFLNYFFLVIRLLYNQCKKSTK